jgi:uncharacterized SAM-binding protein YcdF (DUF218 family)
VKADAIVALGCRVRRDGTPSAALERRIALALRAYHAGVAPRLIASGGSRWHGHVEALVMQRAFVAGGAPETSVVCDLLSLSTSENARYSARLVRMFDGRRVMLATSSWHQARARANFERAGLRVILPPASWLDTPPPTLLTRLRESVCAWADSCMMPRAR